MSEQVFDSRGVYYFRGRIACPLAGVGDRGDRDSNRLALDDGDTTVTLDRDAARITVHNERSYADKRIIADLQFLADATTADGDETPLGIHLKIMKSGDQISLDLHRHLRTQDRLVDAAFEPFDVVVTGHGRREVVLSPDIATRLVCRPGMKLRVIKSMMSMQDNLAGRSQDPHNPGYLVADMSMGFGLFGPLQWMLVRAQLESLSSDNAPLIERGALVDMLRDGAWEMKLTALSDRWLPEVVKRDLFLFGLDELALLSEVRERGLTEGQTMGFRFDGGRGEVVLGDASESFPAALDVARAYIEFHMLGGLLAEQIARRA
jgi:hypothetical protein